MMQSTNSQSPLVSDDKQPLLHDVESFGTAPPLYPIEESDTELVVGGRRCGFFRKVKAWREGRSPCSARNDPDGKRRKRCKNKARRIFRFLGILFLFFLVIKAYHHYRAIKNIRSLNCTPLDEGHLDQTYVLAVDTPKTPLVFHSSFASPDVHIIRDESLPSGAVHITVKGDVPALPAASFDEDKDKRAMTCLVAHKKFSGAGFVSPVDDTPLPSLTSTTIRIPADMNFPAIKFLGKDSHLSNRRLRRIVNWLRKCHHGEGEAAKH